MTDLKVHDVRGEIPDDDQSIRLMDHPDSAEEIPTLDMSPYLSGQSGGASQSPPNCAPSAGR